MVYELFPKGEFAPSNRKMNLVLANNIQNFLHVTQRHS